MRSLCKTLGNWLVIAAMMSALGGHWAVLQSVAWTTMVVANAQHANLGQALRQTFDGQHPCPLCNTIAKGRQSEKKQDAQFVVSKIDFFYQSGAVVLVSPWQYCQRRAPGTFARNFSAPPLLQPPRGILG